MTGSRPFTAVAAIVLLVVALAHLLRVVEGWQVTIADRAIPQWMSIVAFDCMLFGRPPGCERAILISGTLSGSRPGCVPSICIEKAAGIFSHTQCDAWVKVAI